MTKKKNWVDYKKIKATVTMEMVLRHYGLFDELTIMPGKNALGCCPIHNGKNPRHLSICLKKNIWRCFGECDFGGNILDFVSKMEKCSIRDAAIFLAKHFLDDEEKSEEKTEGTTEPKKDTKKDPKEVVEKRRKKKRASIHRFLLS